MGLEFARGARVLGLVSLALLFGREVAAGNASPAPPRDLTQLSLEDLANLTVTSVSKSPEARADATGAIWVITPEDIERTGATSLAESVRRAPGVQVSRINSNASTVAVRGFASRLSRSVLVLVDGRSVWTPLFAGVYWEAQDTMLQDLDRIEVNRGPGGALFGANAINGVISVVTRRATDTQGGLAVFGGGSEEKGFGSIRYGGKLAADVYYRAYAKYFARDSSEPVGANGFDDSWHIGQGGFRVDRDRGGNTVTVQGDLYAGALGERASYASHTAPFSVAVDGDADLEGHNLLTRWTHASGSATSLQVQAYYDRTRRREPYFEEKRDTFDIEAQQRFPWGGRHETAVGANYRASRSDFTAVPTIVFNPAMRTDDIAGVFGQDEVQLAGGRLRLTVGTKLEWNDYSGWNLEPSARLGWKLTPTQLLWTSASRAVRTSSRLEHDVALDTSVSPTAPVFARALGSRDFEPESVVTYEAGYRAQAGSRVLVDLAGFHGRYDDLATLEPGTPFIERGSGAEPTRTIVPVNFENLQTGTTWGGEVASTLRLSAAWRLQGTYSYLRVTQTPKAGSKDPGGGYAGNSPRHQAYVTSFLTVKRVDLDLSVRRVSEIPIQKVPSYWEADARVAFRPVPRLELALVGQNLVHPDHLEFGGGFRIQRGAYLRARVDW